MTFETLVTCEQLAKHPQWRVFDCRHELASPNAGERAYEAGHIPGALHAHLDRDLASPPTGHNGRHPLPDPVAFLHWLGHCGVRKDDQVVVYDAGEGAFAARLWWLLRAVGHKAVAVLDGGFARWQALALPVSTDKPAVTEIAPTIYAGQWQPAIVNVAAVQANLTAREFLVLDARGANRYAGRDETIDPAGGHIPGAYNRPYTTNLQDGRFKSPEVLRDEFETLLSDTGFGADQIVNQCGSGVTACHNVLAMEIAGLQGSRLYPGSWSEWCGDPARPVATGPEPASL
ncbi:sulfurtransferase [Comamonas testosteroni]|uniref:Sulfurtransferase n=1 Tax=Comamonas testosteroni TaxID=285 RepID=A0A5A7MIG7_COMTE|nr:sulfurtransferase [Comamonas testosteroni]GEQ77482.1 sulfurtransferase [Comamonas testosteroni]